MDVTLQYLAGCPNWMRTEDLVRQALRAVGMPGQDVILREVRTPEEAERLSFHGSPTVLIDGTDPFAQSGDPVGLTCRLYRVGTGLAGSPTVEQLTAALRPHAVAANRAPQPRVRDNPRQVR